MRQVLSVLLCTWFIFALAACSKTHNEQYSDSAFPGGSAESTNSQVPAESAPTLTLPPSALPSEIALDETGGNDSMKTGIIPIHITVGSTTFTATLHDNETSQALVAQLPLTLRMNELNRLEKYYNLSEDLPAPSAERPATIHAGDIMIWSGNTLVLFYQTFSNSHGGYVLLGKVDDPSNLAIALGSDYVQVSWSLAD
ncbi:cyclophilin-like fold protein [Paenibacillus borealis]|uniref:Cyclophilin-like domain-containing protein n=1 Tax=Paenibacillus borealis TaxID=160799 RepID=A0A089LFF8_PAEBO|nr:cyclophilin-like fold protein [Paenibacillus borealis]AIQ58825.1 hypothetical protein PBOR_19220 [Paenibacillus borealis]